MLYIAFGLFRDSGLSKYQRIFDVYGTVQERLGACTYKIFYMCILNWVLHVHLAALGQRHEEGTLPL